MFGRRAEAVGDQRALATAGAAAADAVRKGGGPFQAWGRTAERDLAAAVARLGIARPRDCAVFEAAADRSAFGDDIGDLTGKAGYAERPAVDDLDSRSPLTRTLSFAWPSPRPWSCEMIVNPGTCRSMSSALRGAKRAKSAGV